MAANKSILNHVNGAIFLRRNIISKLNERNVLLYKHITINLGTIKQNMCRCVYRTTLVCLLELARNLYGR